MGLRIIVRLQFELGGKHHLPHVHAEYQEEGTWFKIDPIGRI
jgi:hypothetical protein